MPGSLESHGRNGKQRKCLKYTLKWEGDLISHPPFHLNSVLPFFFSTFFVKVIQRGNGKFSSAVENLVFTKPFGTWALFSSSASLSSIRCRKPRERHESYRENHRTMFPLVEDLQDKFPQHMERSHPGEMAAIKTSTCRCHWGLIVADGASPACARQTSSDDAPLYSDVLIHHSVWCGSHP